MSKTVRRIIFIGLSTLFIRTYAPPYIRGFKAGWNDELERQQKLNPDNSIIQKFPKF